MKKPNKNPTQQTTKFSSVAFVSTVLFSSLFNQPQSTDTVTTWGLFAAVAIGVFAILRFFVKKK